MGSPTGTQSEERVRGEATTLSATVCIPTPRPQDIPWLMEGIKLTKKAPYCLICMLQQGSRVKRSGDVDCD